MSAGSHSRVRATCSRVHSVHRCAPRVRCVIIHVCVFTVSAGLQPHVRATCCFVSSQTSAWPCPSTAPQQGHQHHRAVPRSLTHWAVCLARTGARTSPRQSTSTRQQAGTATHVVGRQAVRGDREGTRICGGTERTKDRCVCVSVCVCVCCVCACVCVCVYVREIVHLT